MILPLLLVRRLDQHSFGVYKLVFLVVTTAITLLPFGFGMSAYYFLPRERDRQGAVILNILLFLATIGVCGGLLVALVPQLLLFIARGDQAVVPFSSWIGAVIALWIVGSFLDVAPIANHEARLGSQMMLGVSLIRTLLLVAAAAIFATIQSLLVAALVYGLIQIGVLLFYLAKRFPGFWRAFDRELLKSQLVYALPLGSAGLLYIFQTDLHNYFVSHRFGPSAFAVYSIGCFDLPLVFMLTEAAASVLMPRVSELQKTGETREIILVTLRATRKLSAVLFPAYIFLMVMAGEVLTFLFTARYLESSPIFRINLTLLPLSVFLLDPIVRVYAQYRYRLVGLHVVLFLLLLANLPWATARFNLVGAITVVVAVRLVERTTIVLAASRVLKFRRADAGPLVDVAKLALISAVAGIAAAAARWSLIGNRPIVLLLVCGMVFTTVYLLLVFLMHLPEPDETALLRRTAMRLRQVLPGG